MTEFRCIHGFMRSCVPCEQCGDYDPCAAHEARNNGHRKPRKAVISKHHGPPMSGRERLKYARRERRGL